ncbi:hypothetical protein EGM88_10015 [Aureibaculum marinum]|uniref:Uncharacterized protein n=1 Tax=Aureibaculum marinum TaxID=2487930 RepID=A0A3N4NMA8_9FLAO|nr:hypothetical protein [Aureibaculum marinum]RPD96685.1 hypothetical protein EGM88_10015 [Aureibaculum marinum]
MAKYFIDPLTLGIREFDENIHPLENYKFYAWTGLGDRGKLNGYINQGELENLAGLALIIKTYTHENPCD